MWQKKRAYKSIKVQMVNQVKADGRINSFRNDGGVSEMVHWLIKVSMNQ